MTIPHQMNCPHSPDGWCLACVRQLVERHEQDLALTEIAWEPVGAGGMLPEPGQLVLVTGDSGMRTHERFFTAAYYDPGYPLAPWRSVGNDSLGDDGYEPQAWLRSPTLATLGQALELAAGLAASRSPARR